MATLSPAGLISPTASNVSLRVNCRACEGSALAIPCLTEDAMRNRISRHQRREKKALARA
jgi:hypothetical protein